MKDMVSVLLAWFTQSARDLPWRRTCDPYAVWISEIMLQQTQVKTVIPYWERWMQVLPDVSALAKSETQTVLKLWEGLGYYSRARNAQAAAKVIMTEQGGRFPRDFDAVIALPGIGRYTAGAICSIAFNLPVPILDGNVARVLARLHTIAGPLQTNATKEQLWALAGNLVSTAEKLPDARLTGVADCALQIAENFEFDNERFARLTGRRMVFSGNCSMLNQALMELGALICVPRQPQCNACPLKSFCRAHEKGQEEQFPEMAKRAAVVKRRVVALVVKKGNRYLIRQRPETGVNGGLWEFPNVEVAGKSIPDAIHPFQLIDANPLIQFSHSITHHRIQLQAYSAKCPDDVDGVWKTWEQLQKLPFTGAHRRILDTLK